MARKVSASTLRRVLNVWPPFLFAGIRVRTISDDYRHARVELRQRWYNRNFVGTHFGGSLFAMTDPFWMIMTMQALGDGYIVWDKAATIEFRSEEHTSELQSLMRISYAVFCLKKKITHNKHENNKT